MSRLLMDTDSKPVLLPKFKYFSTPGTTTEIEKTYILKLSPLATIHGARVFEFQCIGTSNEVIDINKTKLKMKIKFKRKDGNPITNFSTLRFGPVNGIGHSIFQTLKIWIGDQLVNSSGDMYPLLNQIQVLFNYELPAIVAQFHNQAMYDFDRNNQFQNYNYPNDIRIPAVPAATNVPAREAIAYTHLDTNVSFYNRNNFLGYDKEVELLIPIQMSLTNQSRVIPQRTDLRFQFTKGDPEYYLMGNTEGITPSDYDIEITFAELWITKHIIEDTKLAAQEEIWKKMPVKIPIFREVTSFHTMQSGFQDITIPNLHLGQVPDRIIFGIMRAENFSGSFKTNPFYFEHHNLESIDFRLNSESLPGMPIKMDYANNNFMEAYSLLTKPWYRKNKGHYIAPHSFPHGYGLYNIDTSHDGYSSVGAFFPVLRTGGVLDLHLKFSTAPDYAIVLVFIFYFNNMIKIHYDSSVTYDYAS